MEHDATNPPQYLDAEVDGSGRADAVLSESKARSTQEAPRGCEASIACVHATIDCPAFASGLG
ncbi:hypothetical protein HaLaN_23854, partial [Haematococcus lacustris]